MDFELCHIAWQAMGLLPWLQRPRYDRQGRLHQVYQLQTACGVYVLKHWYLCHANDFNAQHLKMLCQITQHLHTHHVWCNPEYFLCLDHDAQRLWTYSRWVVGNALPPKAWHPKHIMQCVEALLSVHRQTMPNVQAFPPRSWSLGGAPPQRAAWASTKSDDDLVLCHGDMQSVHILWHKDQLVGLIDWECVGWVPRLYAVLHAALSMAVLEDGFDLRLCQAVLHGYHAQHPLPVEGLLPAYKQVMQHWSEWALYVDGHQKCSAHTAAYRNIRDRVDQAYPDIQAVLS